MNNALGNHDCPALMSDGRQPGTDYRPNCEVNDIMIKQNGIVNSHDYRQFLIHNANNIMNLNRQYYQDLNQCNSCRFYQVDVNNNDLYWDKFTSWLGYKRS